MAKLTVSALRKQIAALEARAAKLTQAEMKSSVAKVRALMDSLGVTIEHLGARVSKAAGDAKRSAMGSSVAAKKRSSKRTGAGVAKYADPKTGKTWTGFGRAPAWLASVKNRDKFLVVPAQAASADAAPSAPRKAAKSTGASAKAAVKRVERKSAAKSKTPRAAVKKVAERPAKAPSVSRRAKATDDKARAPDVTTPTVSE